MSFNTLQRFHTAQAAPDYGYANALEEIVLKLVSSLTLFEQVSRDLQAEEANPEYEALASVAQRVLSVSSAQGYPACATTKDALAKEFSAQS